MAKITVFLYDGAGKPFTDRNAYVHFRQGMQNLHSGFVDSSSLKAELSLRNLIDPVAVVASHSNYRECGYLLQPDKVQVPGELHLMMVHKDEDFNFEPNLWEVLLERRPAYAGFLSRITDGPTSIRKLIDARATRASVACFLNILESMQWLPNGEALIATLHSMKLQTGVGSTGPGIQQDRIFLEASEALIIELGKEDIFADAPNLLHKGADKGYKESGRFTEANLNFSLTTKGSGIPSGLVRADVDLDYYADGAAHFVLEVIPNTVGTLIKSWFGKKPQRTNPVRTYAMRWMGIRNYAGDLAPVDSNSRAAGARFDPLFTIGKG